MKRFVLGAAAVLSGVFLLIGQMYSFVDAQDATVISKCYKDQGGDRIVCKSGGAIDILTGAELRSNATPVPIANLAGAITPGVAAASKVIITDTNSAVSGMQIIGGVQVATPALTAVAGVNDASGRLVIIPTAAANGQALTRATPRPGDFQIFCNQGPNAARAKMGGVTTLNGTAAGSALPLATKQCGVCFNWDGTDTMCGLLTVPTPGAP